MRINTTKHGYLGVLYRQNADAVITGQLESTDDQSSIMTIMFWLGKRDVLSELRYSGSSVMVDYALTFEAALQKIRLSERERQVFHARYERNLSVGEIVGLLGISRQAINTYCRRIATKLLERLNGGAVNFT